jgi:putative spermidine/putrescine transport system ATP-binding protein
LLGIASEEKPAAETAAEPEAKTDPAEGEQPQAQPVAPAAVQPPEKSVAAPSEDAEEADEPPRVGVAVAPRASLLSSAFPRNDNATEAEQARFAEALADRTEAPAADAAARPPVDAKTVPDPVPAAEPMAEVPEPLPSPIEVEPTVAASTPFVRFKGVTKTYDGANLVVKQLDLDIARGEFLTLLGPSGSGKTTTLMMLAGFEQPTSGDILLNGTTLTELPPHKRGLGFVFQNYALFPHMSVQENVAFPLEVRRIRGSEIRERVARALAMVELTGFEKRKPAQLSGGQQQRVAMARALVFDPDLVLMDEPLGALDKHLREQMQYELKRLHRELGVTVVYVTHDQGEALTLSDRIAVFHDGVIQQLDTPARIYQEPANAFVAGFIGENNALPGKVVSIRGDECVFELIGGARVRALNGNCDSAEQTGVVCVRPEHLSISSETAPGGNHVAALVEDYIFHGDHVRVKLSAPGMGEIHVKTPAHIGGLPAKGVAVTLCWEPASARAFAS